MTGELEFYATPGPMTTLGPHSVAGVGPDIGSVAKIVQGVVVHPMWAQAYQVELDEQRQQEVQLRSTVEILDKIFELSPEPLSVGRLPQQRFAGNCRHFATLTTALLRANGVPARARCGFGTYFDDGMAADHWTTEWWDGSRWVVSDTQLDAVQVAALKLDFDPLDMPPGRFLVGGEAWKLFRSGERPGGFFGLGEMRGESWIRGNLVRDVASLSKMEMLPWDGWGLMLDASGDATSNDELLDLAADVTVAADFDRVRELYERDEFRVPDEITVFWPEVTRVVLRTGSI